MTYKDPDKQREADAERQRRRRDKIKAKGVTESGCDKQGVTVQGYKPNDVGGTKLITKPERTVLGNIRVSKPGDDDYVPQCETTRAFIEGRDKRPETGKRGKDIKVFADLPPDVQANINRTSDSEQERKLRTACAIHYQHMSPDRFHSTGVAV